MYIYLNRWLPITSTWHTVQRYTTADRIDRRRFIHSEILLCVVFTQTYTHKMLKCYYINMNVPLATPKVKLNVFRAYCFLCSCSWHVCHSEMRNTTLNLTDHTWIRCYSVLVSQVYSQKRSLNRAPIWIHGRNQPKMVWHQNVPPFWQRNSAVTVNRTGRKPLSVCVKWMRKISRLLSTSTLWVAGTSEGFVCLVDSLYDQNDLN